MSTHIFWIKQAWRSAAACALWRSTAVGSTSSNAHCAEINFPMPENLGQSSCDLQPRGIAVMERFMLKSAHARYGHRYSCSSHLGQQTDVRGLCLVSGQGERGEQSEKGGQGEQREQGEQHVRATKCLRSAAVAGVLASAAATAATAAAATAAAAAG